MTLEKAPFQPPSEETPASMEAPLYGEAPAYEETRARSTPNEEERHPAAPRKWIWILLAAVAGLAFFLLFLRGTRGQDPKGGKTPDAPAARAVPVVVAAATKKDMGVHLTGLGTVTPLSTVTVRSRVDGQIIDLAFREGQLVHEGDLLAEIDPRPFRIQLLQAQGQKAKDEAALNNARVDLQRYQTLADQDLIPKQQLDTQRAMVEQFEAALQTDQGQIESARLNLAYSRITAPITGKVGLRLVDRGNIVHANDPTGLVVITQLQPITVVFTIPADQLPKVLGPSRGGGHLPVEAFDRELKTRLATGSLQAIDNQIDPATGTVRLKAEFGNEDGALYPNQFVNARVLVDTLREAVVVPTAAIQRSPDGTFVYVVKSDDTVDARSVEIQMTEGDDTSLRSGMSPGETVVIDGVDKLRPGAKVASSPAAARRDGTRRATGATAASPGAGPTTARRPAAQQSDDSADQASRSQRGERGGRSSGDNDRSGRGGNDRSGRGDQDGSGRGDQDGSGRGDNDGSGAGAKDGRGAGEKTGDGGS